MLNIKYTAGCPTSYYNYHFWDKSEDLKEEKNLLAENTSFYQYYVRILAYKAW